MVCAFAGCNRQHCRETSGATQGEHGRRSFRVPPAARCEAAPARWDRTCCAPCSSSTQWGRMPPRWRQRMRFAAPLSKLVYSQYWLCYLQTPLPSAGSASWDTTAGSRFLTSFLSSCLSAPGTAANQRISYAQLDCALKCAADGLARGLWLFASSQNGASCMGGVLPRFSDPGMFLEMVQAQHSARVGAC